ncbi:MAG: bifunctional SulP family inorganic anion transporter/carbonic anhydrase [Capsulimonadales bacterium]|nr:bifunctional SulP family inorganic anion transporter/carbonic anhydrase [Capsulimonadales bacterium]
MQAQATTSDPVPVADRPATGESVPLLQQILRGDLPASLVVFLIAIPLSLGIAVASGAPVLAGLIAGVVGGIVAGALGGSIYQVSGPAAGLTVLVFGTIQQFGWQLTCFITILAGLVQIGFGASRIARAALAISPAVVHGMLAGIGITIALAQLHIVLGGTPESHAWKNLRDLPGQIADLHGPATLLGLVTIGLLIIWQYVPKMLRVIPGPLVAVVVTTAIAALGNLSVKRIDLPENLYQMPSLPALPTGNWGPIAVAVLTIAIIASVESLLSAVAVDKLHSGPRANLDRELVGQGVANTLSGFLGGLPVTGVIVRSSTNVAAGARTRASAILHGIWILLFVSLLGGMIEQIPLAVLAGLLVFVGIRLVKPEDIRELTHHREIVVYVITVVGVVFLNLLEGVLLGIAVALVMLVFRLSRMVLRTDHRGDRYLVRVEGSLTFLSVPNLNRELSAIPPGAKVDIDLAVDFMDHAAFEALHGWRMTHEKLGGTVDIDEKHEQWYESAVSGTPRRDKTTPVSALSAMIFGRKSPNEPSKPLDARVLIEGIRDFQQNSAAAVRPLLSQLARNGQFPTALFITCSDSRVVPYLFTASGPGDLFKVRNIGNLVPPYAAEGENSVGAAIEYAVGVLGVRSIVICGHSHCGAMKALLAGGEPTTQGHLGGWLRHAERSLARFNAGIIPSDSDHAVNQLAQVNVIEQIENLRTYPIVRQYESDARLTLIGLFFDIEEAEVLLFNRNTARFENISAEEIGLTIRPEPAGNLA